MGTSWAVGSAATLGLAALVISSTGGVIPLASSPSFTFIAGALSAVALGAWAYAISVGAHGSRGALAALLANVILASVLGALALGTCTSDACRGSPERIFDVLLILIALLSAWGIGAEIRLRRGALQWLTAAEFALPTLLLTVLVWFHITAGSR